MDIQEKKRIFILALITNAVNYKWEQLSDAVLSHYISSISYSRISDRLIVNEERIRKHIVWNEFDRLQLIRLIAQDTSILSLVDISKYTYSLREIHFVIKNHPNLIDQFNIKLDAVDKNEVKTVMCMGIDSLIDTFDLKKYPFKGKDIFDIIKKHNYSKRILKNINVEKLENYHIAEIVAKGDDGVIDLMDLNKLSAKNWLEILTSKPYLFNMCDLNKFLTCDIFNTIKLVIMFKSQKIEYLLEKRGYDRISAFGWEKLLIADPDTYLPKCDLNKLNKRHWSNIIQFHPNLINYVV